MNSPLHASENTVDLTGQREAPRADFRSPPPTTDLLGAIAALESRLLSCQKLATLGSLTAVIAHEFNNLMTPLVASAELAISTGDPEMMKKTLTRGMNQAQRAIDLSRRVLDLTGAKSDPPTAVRVADAVQAALDTVIRPAQQASILLRVVVPPEIHVLAHRDMLVHLLLNLILNSHKACEDLREMLTISARRDDGQVEIDICDNGKGMLQDHIERVLNPFLAADPGTAPHDWLGVGLGLNACRIIARREGARLHFLLNESRGCTARVFWPAADAP
ncbi:Sensor protein FixL [Phycisphaerae bacterium RAS1]|nr:Sensor protein FixL [Phycisphaerae bacterium RAS1]